MTNILQFIILSPISEIVLFCKPSLEDEEPVECKGIIKIIFNQITNEWSNYHGTLCVATNMFWPQGPKLRCVLPSGESCVKKRH